MPATIGFLITDSAGRPMAITYRKDDIYNTLAGTILLADYRDDNRNGLSKFEKYVGGAPLIRDALRSRLFHELGHREFRLRVDSGAGIDNMAKGYFGLVKATGNMVSAAFQQRYVAPLAGGLIDIATAPLFMAKKKSTGRKIFEVLVKEALSQWLERAIMNDMKLFKKAHGS